MADTADYLERRKMWRHLMQSVLAEQSARVAGDELRLLAEGMRVDAAIDALDETLTAPALIQSRIA